jgi:hypothetical protein
MRAALSSALVSVGGLVLSVMLAACGPNTTASIPAKQGSRSATSVTIATVAPLVVPTTTVSASTSPLPASAGACTSDQLQAEFGGVQGAVGNLAGSFVVADTSEQPCSLMDVVTVNLLDAGDHVALTTSKAITTPIVLGADRTLPTLPVIGAQDLQVATLSLFWPTDPNHAASLDCGKETDFSPAVVQLTFNDSATVTIRHPDYEGQVILICGSDLWVEFLGPS